MAAKAIPLRDFGAYRLCARLASGGMGTVYLAKRTDARGVLVALKRIHEHLAEQPKFVKMFHDEARIAALIDHPNVCSVLDFGEVDGTPFLAMPFLVGETLSTLVERLAEEPPEAIECFLFARIMIDACEGLHAAHELVDADGQSLHVVHRDVTPHNLFVGYDGTVSVLDFGVATARHKLASTVTGEVKGKFAYMAPEHLDGVGTDRRSDVWSLGVVLWEALARERLFAGDNMADTVKAVLSGAVPSLSEHRFDVPLGLEEIVFRALARDRETRYPTARAMADDLRAFLREEEVAVVSHDVSRFMHGLFPQGEVAQHALVGDSTGVFDLVPSGHRELVFEDAPTRELRVSDVRSRRSRGVMVALGAAALGVLLGMTMLVPHSDSLQKRPAPLAAAPPEPPPLQVGPVTVVTSPGEAPDEVPPDDALTFRLEDLEPPAEELETVPDVETPSMRRTPMRTRRGTVNVATPGGWAVVFADGRRVGEAPGSFALSAGNHEVEIQPFGRGAKIRRTVRVRPGARSRISVSVQP